MNLENILQDTYKRENFIWLASKILQLEISEPIKVEGESEKIEEINLIGEKDVDSRSICILEVKLKNTVLERSPVYQRDEVIKYINSKGSDAALVAYYKENELLWKISLVTISYFFDESGKVHIKPPSEAKKFWYIVGKGKPIRTAQQQLSNLLNRENSYEDILNAFSIEPVTKAFYQEIANWYFWALKNVKFPKDAEAEAKANGRNIAVIRFITRIIFIWFMKQKGLIKDELFDEKQIESLLQDFSPNSSTYYNAILQNLFFATLNTPINERDFRTEERVNGFKNEDYMNHRKFRNQRFFKNPEKVKSLFNYIPFLNGGLFDCLDRGRNDPSNTTDAEIRIDGFSDIEWKQPKFPNFLLFSEERFVDLNEDYGTRGKKYPAKGLINILKSYNFTVEENTPIEQEIALDPELLGKVFENLLASYNPETATTARKATGSYYTPREIVYFMVDQSLKEYFKSKLLNQIGNFEDKLDTLFSYSTAENPFSDDETNLFISEINAIKVIDPAVGTGAFPMGVLQRLTFILSKLDPHNSKWKIQQIKGIEENVKDPDLKKHLIDHVEISFKKNELDYGRKLYIIQNCLYGVDIQPIAIQIAKLRFFISLLVNENIIPEDSTNNYGIEPLPNLETKLVCANSLIGLDSPEMLTLPSQNIINLENHIQNKLAEYFTAFKKDEKEKIKREYRELIKKLKVTLDNEGFPSNITENLISWDPFNSNIACGWFSPKWMFGVTEGFDIVIANPPYLEARSSEFSYRMKDEAQKGTKFRWGCDSEFITRGSDLLIYFLAIGIYLLSEKGTSVFITQNSWLDTDYGRNFQKFLLKNTTVKAIIDSDFKYFDSKYGPNINTVISIFFGKKPIINDFIVFIRYHENFENINTSLLCSEIRQFDSQIEIKQFGYSNPILKNIKWGILLSSSEEILKIFSLLEEKGVHLNKLSNYNLTIGQGLNLKKSFIVNEKTIDDFPFISKHLIPFVTAEDGAPFVLKKTKNYIINGEKFDKTQLKELKKNGIEIFFQESTNKIQPLLILPRGVSKHFCAINSISAYSSSCVDIYDIKGNFPKEGMLNLWLFLNSTIGYLIRELTGRKSLGGGLLKAEATDLRELPIYFNFDRYEDIKNIFERLINREALHTIDEINTEEHREIDKIVFDFLEIPKKQREIIIEYLKTKISERFKKSKT